MQKKFVKNLAFILALNLLIKPFWLFGIDRVVQNNVGHEEYGLYWALFNLSYIFQIILDMGIAQFNNRNIARNPSLLSKYFSSIVTLKIFLATLYCIILFSVGLSIGHLGRNLQLLAFLAINQIIASYIIFLRSNISALHRFKVDSIFSVLDRSLMIIICGSVLYGNITEQAFQIEWFIYIQTISYSITALIAFLYVFRKAKVFIFKIDIQFLITIIKSSYPFALLAILITVYTRMDGIMIERLLPNGKEEAGIYASGYRILDAVNMIAFLFSTLLLPIFSRMLKKKEDVIPLVKTSFSLFFYPAFVLVSACFFYQVEIMDLLYKESGLYNARIFGFLIINYLAMGSIYIFGTLLTANKTLKFLNIISCIGLILNVILNFILIPKYHAFGAVIATLFTQFFVSAVQVFRAINLFKISFNILQFVKASFFFIIVICLFYFLKELTHNWIYNIIILCITATLIAFALKLVNVGFLMKLLISSTEEEND